MQTRTKIILTSVITAVSTAAVMGAVGCYAMIYKSSVFDKFEKKVSMINRYLES